MYCMKCGAEIPENAKFCNVCGAAQNGEAAVEQTPVEAASVAAEPVETAPVEAAPVEAVPAVPATPVEAAPVAPVQAAPVDVPPVAANPVETAPGAMPGQVPPYTVAPVQAAPAPSFAEKAANSVILQDAKNFLKKLFSKEPASVIPDAADSKSLFWIIALVLNVLVFPFAYCCNVIQIANYWIRSLIMYSGLELPFAFGGYWSLALAAILIFTVEFAVVYLFAVIGKAKPQSPMQILNVVAVSSIPLTAVLVLNLILGLIFPPATVCLLVGAVFVHVLLLYEGMRHFLQEKFSPIWLAGITFLVIAIVMVIFVAISVRSAIGSLMDYALGGMNSSFGNMFNW